MTPRPTPYAQLQQLARRVERLCPRTGDPESFHVEKSDIVGSLRGLAGQLLELNAVQPSTSFHRTAADADPRLRGKRAANDNFRQLFRDR